MAWTFGWKSEEDRVLKVANFSGSWVDFKQILQAVFEGLTLCCKPWEVNCLSFKVQFVFEGLPRVQDILNVLPSDLIHFNCDL